MTEILGAGFDRKEITVKKMQKQGTGKKIHGKFLLIIAALAVTAVLLLSLAGVFQVKVVTVTGNAYYTKEEIVDFVLGDGYIKNTLYLYFKYKYLEHPVIPFIDTLEVEMDSVDSITIRVYEKGIVGYVKYLGKNVYFDKDGTVVESSDELMEGVPLIGGLSFNRLAMYQPLSVQDSDVFGTILSITQLLKKYSLTPDEIRFGNIGDIYLNMGEVRIALGTGAHLEEKIARIKQLEPDLDGKSGTLHMENYTDDSTHISLEAVR